MRELAIKTGRDELYRCLFGVWTRQDQGLSLRWDPEDDRRYALRWRNPSSEETGTEWGGNRLAFEALPLFPVAPSGRNLSTTGFSREGREILWTWPIWEPPIDLDTARSLLALPELQKVVPDRASLASMGVPEVYRSRRIHLEQGRLSLSPSKPV